MWGWFEDGGNVGFDRCREDDVDRRRCGRSVTPVFGWSVGFGGWVVVRVQGSVWTGATESVDEGQITHGGIRVRRPRVKRDGGVPGSPWQSRRDDDVAGGLFRRLG